MTILNLKRIGKELHGRFQINPRGHQIMLKRQIYL